MNFVSSSSGVINLATSTPGQYTVFNNIAASGACAAAQGNATITITATPNATIASVNSICSNADAITLIANPSGGAFSGTGVTGWQFNPALANVGNNVVNYSITVDGCTGNAASTITVLDSPTASLTAFAPICLQNGVVTLTGGYPENGVYSGTGVNGNTFNPTVAGTIAIDYTYTASNGCADNAANTITVNDCAGIEEVSSINFSIAPNPASDELTITINSELTNDVVYTMISEDGKVVIPTTSINTSVTNINVNQFAEGMYFLQLINANGITVKKVIIK